METTKVTDREMSEAMLRAADYMKKHGHTKHVLEDKEGRVCLYGALLLVTTGDLDDGCNPVADAALGLLGVRLGSKPEYSYCEAINWNNADERTADEVITLLKETGESLKEAA